MSSNANPFKGEWDDEDGNDINIAGSAGNLTVIYGTGRGPFQGFTLDLAASIINVNFSDDAPFSGVLVAPGSCIQWSNGTKWVRKGTQCD